MLKFWHARSFTYGFLRIIILSLDTAVKITDVTPGVLLFWLLDGKLTKRCSWYGLGKCQLAVNITSTTTVTTPVTTVAITHLFQIDNFLILILDILKGPTTDGCVQNLKQMNDHKYCLLTCQNLILNRLVKITMFTCLEIIITTIMHHISRNFYSNLANATL